MTRMKRVFRLHAGLFTAAVLMWAVPIIAGAVPVNLSGSVTTVQAFGDSPFSAGDSLSGTFDVDIGADNAFSSSDLNDFSLTVGPAVFDLASSDFGTFSGQLSSDGSTLADFAVASAFVAVPGLAGSYSLGFNGVNQPFSVNGSGSIASGDFTTTVGGGGGPAAVPEPSSLLLFLFAVLGLSAAAFGRQRRVFFK